MKNDLSRLRLASIMEGLSYIFLLFIAMPLKYYYGYPVAVRYTGMVHGVLCIMLILSIVKANA